MNYIKYSVRPTKLQNCVAVICYALPDDRGTCRLLSIAWNGEAADFFKQVTMREIPPTITYVQGDIPVEMMPWKAVGCEIKDVSNLDLSFDHFWQLYDRKVGNKARVEKKWNELKVTDRILALGVVVRMQRYYTERNLGVPFPETFLNQRRWENIYD